MIFILSFLILLGFIGCTTTPDEIPDWPWQDTEEEIPEEVVEDATLDKWTDVSSEYGALPEHIKV